MSQYDCKGCYKNNTPIKPLTDEEKQIKTFEQYISYIRQAYSKNPNRHCNQDRPLFQQVFGEDIGCHTYKTYEDTYTLLPRKKQTLPIIKDDTPEKPKCNNCKYYHIPATSHKSPCQKLRRDNYGNCDAHTHYKTGKTLKTKEYVENILKTNQQQYEEENMILPNTPIIENINQIIKKEGPITIILKNQKYNNTYPNITKAYIKDKTYPRIHLTTTTGEDITLYQNYYKNLSEIGKERIKRAGDKILKDKKINKIPPNQPIIELTIPKQ